MPQGENELLKMMQNRDEGVCRFAYLLSGRRRPLRSHHISTNTKVTKAVVWNRRQVYKTGNVFRGVSP